MRGGCIGGAGRKVVWEPGLVDAYEQGARERQQKGHAVEMPCGPFNPRSLSQPNSSLPATPSLSTLPSQPNQAPGLTMGMSAVRPKQLCFWMMQSENSSSSLLS